MALPVSEIVTTTMQHRSRKVADNVLKHNALLATLKMKDKIRSVSGGHTINEELMYDENQTHMWYSGYETLDIRPSITLTSAQYPWKQQAIAVTISGLEGEVQNTGPEQAINLLTSRIENAEKTMLNRMSEAIYSDGTGYGGKQLTGLAAQVSTTPETGTVGSIPRTSYAFWRNQKKSGAAITANNILSEMRKMWLSLCRGSDKPDIIIMDNEMYNLYWGALQAQQRFTNQEKMAKMGWTGLMFVDAPVIADGGFGGFCPDKTIYFLNCDYFYLRPHARRNMVPYEKTRYNVNQDAMVQYLLWAGNMCMSNASLQGVIRGT